MSLGRGTLNFIEVLMVGFGPEALGYVLMFWIADDSGGTKLLRLKETKAFLTGKKPGDWRFLKPRISMLTSNFSTLTLALRSTL